VSTRPPRDIEISLHQLCAEFRQSGLPIPRKVLLLETDDQGRVAGHWHSLETVAPGETVDLEVGLGNNPFPESDPRHSLWAPLQRMLEQASAKVTATIVTVGEMVVAPDPKDVSPGVPRLEMRFGKNPFGENDPRRPLWTKGERLVQERAAALTVAHLAQMSEMSPAPASKVAECLVDFNVALFDLVTRVRLSLTVGLAGAAGVEEMNRHLGRYSDHVLHSIKEHPEEWIAPFLDSASTVADARRLASAALIPLLSQRHAYWTVQIYEKAREYELRTEQSTVQTSGDVAEPPTTKGENRSSAITTDALHEAAEHSAEPGVSDGLLAQGDVGVDRPPSEALQARRRKLVDDFQQAKGFKSRVELCAFLRIDRSAFYGLIAGERGRYGEATRTKFLRGLGVTLEDWMREPS
jgi:hypothetical protein